MDKKKARCPKCKNEFDIEDAISSTLICPDCACVFSMAEEPDSNTMQSNQMSAADIVAKNSEAAAKIIGQSSINTASLSISHQSPSASDATVISGSAPSGISKPASANKPENESEQVAAHKPAINAQQPANARNTSDSNSTVIAETRDPAKLKEGDIVGSYKIIKVLGRGAMGVVLLVIDEMLNRKAALKFIGYKLSSNKNCKDRFVREGRMLASLPAHPNLVSVYSGGEWLGVPYFTMEYIKGMALNEMLKIKNPVPVETALSTIRDTAKGLDFVWQNAKLIHRDIKPANLMYDNEKEITVVTDFGLAKPDKHEFDSTLTAEGAILGTPDYISPEQIRCEHDLDWRADVYSLGCTLFHLLSGKAPFTGKSIGDLISAHLKDPVPELKEDMSECPEELSTLVKEMMNKNREKRPESYESIISQLDLIHKTLKA